MTGDRLRKRVRRIVERDIASGAHSTSLLHADILALLDADPDTPTTDTFSRVTDMTVDPRDMPNDCQACRTGNPSMSHTCGLTLEQRRPDAPVDDGLVEQIARAEYAYDCRNQTERNTYAWESLTDLLRDTWRDRARALVVARPWQAEVEAARQDARADLWTWGDVLKAKAEARRDTLNWAASFGTLPGKTWPETLRCHAEHRAARGETRQP